MTINITLIKHNEPLTKQQQKICYLLIQKGTNYFFIFRIHLMLMSSN